MKPKSESFWRAGFGKGKDTERQQSYEAGTSETVSPCAILPGVKEEKVGPFICDRPHDLAKKILEFRIRELRFSFCCLPFSVLYPSLFISHLASSLWPVLPALKARLSARSQWLALHVLRGHFGRLSSVLLVDSPQLLLLVF